MIIDGAKLAVIAFFVVFVTVAAAHTNVLPPRSVPGAVDPRVTQENIDSTICKAGYTKTVRPPVSYTNAIKRRLMAASAIPWSKHGAFELDHRVPLEAGGAPRDKRNLWLQPRHGTWTAGRKDSLENFVHREICARAMTLKEGKAIFLAPDWRIYYRKFFHN